jgi:hypothetical protein
MQCMHCIFYRKLITCGLCSASRPAGPACQMDDLDQAARHAGSSSFCTLVGRRVTEIGRTVSLPWSKLYMCQIYSEFAQYIHRACTSISYGHARSSDLLHIDAAIRSCKIVTIACRRAPRTVWAKCTVQLRSIKVSLLHISATYQLMTAR